MNKDENIILKSKKYLKYRCLETVVSMDILENDVVEGNGRLKVDCTVKFLGLFKSNWIKTFTFNKGKIVSMDAMRKNR
jgi:hypothetical protein